MNEWGMTKEEILKDFKESVEEIGRQLDKEFPWPEPITAEWFSDECLKHVEFGGYQAFKNGILISLTGHFLNKRGNVIRGGDMEAIRESELQEAKEEARDFLSKFDGLKVPAETQEEEELEVAS